MSKRELRGDFLNLKIEPSHSDASLKRGFARWDLCHYSIGVDRLPATISLSKYLTGNDLGQLGNLENLPSVAEIESLSQEFENPELFDNEEKVHLYAKSLIEEGEPYEALKILMIKNPD